MYLCVLYGFGTQQELFPNTALTGFYSPGELCLLHGTNGIFKYSWGWLHDILRRQTDFGSQREFLFLALDKVASIISTRVSFQLKNTDVKKLLIDVIKMTKGWNGFQERYHNVCHSWSYKVQSLLYVPPSLTFSSSPFSPHSAQYEASL